MTATAKPRRSKSSKAVGPSRSAKLGQPRYIGKPAGIIQHRVQAVGPSKFGIISVDCAKQRSKWFLCNFFGKVIIEPTVVEHNAGALHNMASLAMAACREAGFVDSIAAVEMTGIYHRPVQNALRKAGFDTRLVHPYASKHYQQRIHPNDKNDDKDEEAIFLAAINGFGLATFPVDEAHASLQAVARHRRNLVKHRSSLQVQIRCLIHQCMPGFADQFQLDKLFSGSVAMPIAKQFSSAQAIRQAGVDGMAKYLKLEKVRFQRPTLERIFAWARNAAEPAEMAHLLSVQWKQLARLRDLLTEQIAKTEGEMAKFLVKTPYVLLLSVTGINVVSAATFAGEAGPIEHYASDSALKGRAGLYPRRYQSDSVDIQTSLARNCNRRLRSAALMIAENLIKCHSHYRGIAQVLKAQKVHPRDRKCRIANRAMRMIYQLVAGKKVWHDRSVDREYILYKLREFHREHHTPATQVVEDLREAITWLPKSAYRSEAQPLLELTRKRKQGVQPLGDLLLPLLIRLGVTAEKIVESESSEARKS
jgi:transposase